MSAGRFSDKELRWITWGVVLMFSALTLLVPTTAGDVVDVDELVYVETLHSMQDGQGYYPAMRDALISKESEPPTQVRSFRTPLVFWMLHLVPASLWHFAASISFALAIGTSVLLARPFGNRAAIAAAVGVGTMAVAYSTHLYLHAEIWALPPILGGLMALRGDHSSAPWLLALGLALRELFAVLFLLCAIFGWFKNSRHRAHWLAASAAVSAFGLIHAYRASEFVSATGYEAPFGNEKLNPTFVISAISPGVGWLSWTLGVGIVAFGLIGLFRVLKSDPIAPIVAAHVAIMLPLTLILGRVYWGFTFVPLLAIYVATRSPREQELSKVLHGESSEAKQLAPL